MTPFSPIGGIGPQEIWEGVTGRAVHGERLSIALVELEPNAVVPEHAHDNEQAGIMVEGSFEMRVGDETREMVRGDAWCIPPAVPHAVVVGPNGAVVVEVWVPARDDWQGIPAGEPRAPRGF